MREINYFEINPRILGKRLQIINEVNQIINILLVDVNENDYCKEVNNFLEILY